MDSWPAWQDSPNDEEGGETLKLMERAALVARTALAGFDFLVQKAGDVPELHAMLMKERLAIHGVLDDVIRAKIEFKRTPRDSHEIRRSGASSQTPVE